MPDSEQQEAVCGTCHEVGDGGDCGGCLALGGAHRMHAAGRQPSQWSEDSVELPICPAYHKYDPITAPVVPSDDLDGERARWLSSPGKWQPDEPAPPTPSHDAEGDGRTQKHYPLRARDTAREAIKIATGNGGHEHKVQAIANMLIDRDEVRESAVRAPYEELVKAAQGALECGVFDCGEGHDEAACDHFYALRAALAHIEESLGGRK